MKEKLQVIAERLINTVNESTCAFTATKAAINRLQGAGFEELTLEDNWETEVSVHEQSNINGPFSKRS